MRTFRADKDLQYATEISFRRCETLYTLQEVDLWEKREHKTQRSGFLIDASPRSANFAVHFKGNQRHQDVGKFNGIISQTVGCKPPLPRGSYSVRSNDRSFVKTYLKYSFPHVHSFGMSVRFNIGIFGKCYLP